MTQENAAIRTLEGRRLDFEEEMERHTQRELRCKKEMLDAVVARQTCKLRIAEIDDALAILVPS